MDELEKSAVLIEEVVRRFMRRYQEHLVGDDYRRRVIDLSLADLPDIVRSSLAAARVKTADPDGPSPYDRSAVGRLTGGRRRTGVKVG